VKRYVEEIKTDLGELEALLDNVLTTARLEIGPNAAGGLPVQRAPFAVIPWIQELAERFRASHPGRPLEVELPSGLPTLEGDAALLRRAIANVLDNAAKYSGPSDPVTLVTRLAPGEVLLEIRDRGIGIDAADLPNLFTPFFRTDRSRARGTGGVGLGLALSRRIALAHGGTLEVESEPGQGTRVRFRIPAGAPSA
jgi:signal transduction histidine kinase